MSLTRDQKKHLLIGGSVGALALAAGYALFSSRAAHAASLPSGRGAGGRHQRHPHEGQGGQAEIQAENDRGEYGPRHHRQHHQEHWHDR